ncbi:MAG: hypothetical protein LBN27_11830, partial [Prevotellaceae bacterium]|nr:hypothetical protein [Prevotellaceae bacterium]
MSIHSRKRSNIISALKRKGLNFVHELENYAEQYVKNPKDKQAVYNYANKITKCSNLTLYRKDLDTNELDMLANHTCKSKCCPICNFLSQKTVRRKYYKWFSDNREVIEVENPKNGARKITTATQLAKDKRLAGFTERRKLRYDLMHLTLTVPHTESGFRGEEFYFKNFIQLFNIMRNESGFWNYWVYGGEYGIEATGGKWISKELAQKRGIICDFERTISNGKVLAMRKHTDGLHIHIHALLMVRKERQSRNKLHRLILMEWNKLTATGDANRKRFTEEMKASIKKGNATLTDDDIAKLHPNGATIISLENIFEIDKETKKKIHFSSSDCDIKKVMPAILETISYHFEPLAFDKDDKSVDVELLCRLIPKVKNLRMYGKFGCLFSESSLNVNTKPETVLSDYKEAMEILVNEDTGEVIQAAVYFICNPALVWHKKDEQNEKDRVLI